MSAADLRGGIGSPTISYWQDRAYSTDILFRIIDENFMFTASDQPNIEVKVNNLTASCSGDCSYVFISQTPVLTKALLVGSKLNLGVTDPATIGFTTN